jgi:hypothetical protein
MNCAGPKTGGTGNATCSTDGGVPAGNAGDGGPCGIACKTGYHFCNAGGGTGDCLSDTDDPGSDPCVVDFNTGVFVRADATAGGDGTMGKPFQTIGAGIAAAVAGKKRVYVCVGTYNEQLQLTGADDGLSVYGNLDCTNGWKYVSTASTVVVTPAGTAAPATALTLSGNMTGGVLFEDVGFTSLDGVNAGDSSIAVFVGSGAKLTLMGGTVTAGKGVTGVTPGYSPNWNEAGGAAPGGGQPTGFGEPTGGAGGQNTSCLDATTSAGGRGGDVNTIAATCSSGGAGSSNSTPDPTRGQGGQGGATNASCAVGEPGDDGSDATVGGSGAKSVGHIGVSGWTPGDTGGQGNKGGAAYGGGGGGANCETVGQAGPRGGGGGGAGGCGGGPGLGGGPGGSSIAILVDQSALATTNVTVLTAAAGGGGTGGQGQSGQSGGSGFTQSNPDCSGGSGGNGGAGSGGGGGAGGNSIGIAWLGTTGPSVNNTVIASDQATYTGITTGTYGAAGPGGKDGKGNASGSPGVQGSNKAIQQFQ